MSQASVDAARHSVAELEGELASIESEVIRSTERQRAARGGVFLLEDGTDGNSAFQNLADARLRLVQAESALTQLRAEENAARAVLQAGQQAYDKSRSLDITVPPGAMVWTLLYRSRGVRRFPRHRSLPGPDGAAAVGTPPMSGRVELTPDQQAKEHSILFALLLDSVMGTALVTVGILGGSLTMMAEALRGVLNYLMECFSLLLMRRVHRGALVDMEFGSGKVEQVANSLIGSSMLAAAAWIGVGVVRIVTGQRELGSPLGLACAAMFGAINFYVNLRAWDSVRRAAASGTGSLIMQLNLRLVKLCSSLVVGVSLTIAALSTDDVIVAFADGLGSLFVAGYLAVNAISGLRSSIPDLLDRSAGKDVREVVTRALAAHSADYSQVHHSRSRRSGHVTFIEIALGFDMSLSIAEVDRRVEALKQTIRQSLNDAEISIVASSAALKPLPDLAPNG